MKEPRTRRRRSRSAAARGRLVSPPDRRLVARRALITLAEAATAGLRPGEMLDLVVAAAAALAGEATVHLWLVEDERRELRLVAQAGGRPGKAGIGLRPVLRIGEGLAGRIAATRAPLTLQSLRGDRRAANRAWMRDQGFVSFAGVPFARADRLVGVLCLFTWRRHRFTRHEVDLLRSFASHAAVALESAALLEASTTRLRRLETLREIEGEILQQRDPDALLGLIVRRATELLEADSATAYLLEPGAGILRPRASYNTPEAFRDVTIRLDEGVVGRIARTREGMVVNDYPSSPHAIPPFRDMDWAIAAQPLLVSGDVHGVILVRRQAVDRPFSPEDLVQLGDFAVQASIALENARLLRLASARAERVKAAAEVGRLLTSTLDADRILDTIAEKCREILDARAVGLFRLDGDGRLTYARGFGFELAFMAQHTLALGEGAVGKAALERRRVQTVDVLSDPALTLSPAVRARVAGAGSRAIVAAPILVRNAVLGVLAVYHPPGFRAPAEEIEFVETLANHAGAALENARLFAETRRRQQTAETLAALTQTLTGSLDLGTVLSLVADGVRRLLAADGGAIGLVESDGTIRLSVAVGLGADVFRDTIVRPGQGVGGQVLQTGEPFWTPDCLNDPRIGPEFADALRAAGLVSQLAVPVRLREEVVGVLWAQSGHPVQFSDDDIALAADLAQVVAVAVENARLYEEARRREAEARALFEVSRLIAGTLDPDRVLDLVVDKVRGLTGVRACGLFRLDPDGVLRYARGAGLSPAFVQGLTVRLGEGTSGRSVAEGRDVWTADIVADPAVRLQPTTRALVEAEGYRAVLSVPVRVKDGAYGSLATYWWEPHAATPAEVHLLTSLATLAAVALDNARLYAEARASVARLEGLNEELKTAQEHLVQTEKLRALGEMASGVAHDFNNLLAAILGRVQLLMSQVHDETLRRWLQVIERAALDGAQTVRHIQEFTRIRRDTPAETVDLGQVVRDAVEMTQTRWRDEALSRGLDIRVVQELAPVPPVDGHPAELRQVLTNLLFNAIDALPAGGTITVGTAAVGETVEVFVADTGVGMTDEVRRRVFEPFFTTKGPRGTGLGLAMAYGIVSRHGGSVDVESRAGAGARFTIRLPVGRGRTEAAADAAPPGVQAGARVLVVDDEPPVREALADMLRLAHHDVAMASQGFEALERFRAAPFDLVLTDLAMPGMSGWQVAQAVKALRPDVPVVLVTGWGVELPGEQLRASGVDRVMTKPFRMDDVHAVVAGLLASRAVAEP